MRATCAPAAPAKLSVATAASQRGLARQGPLRDILGLTRRNRVRSDLFNAAADALCGDLAALLAGYRRRDFFKLTHRPLAGFHRLLLVLDDFEATAPVLGEFIVGALLPRLAAASHPSLVLIASRDDLEAIHHLIAVRRFGPWASTTTARTAALMVALRAERSVARGSRAALLFGSRAVLDSRKRRDDTVPPWSLS